MGGPRDPDAVARSDDELVATALGALRDLLQLSCDPVLVDSCRYNAAIPQYYAGHAERIEGLRAAIATCPGQFVIGK